MRKPISRYKLDSYIKDFDNNIVVFPTDTVWGMGASIKNSILLEKIYEIKKRNKKKKLPLMISYIEDLNNYFYINSVEYKIARQFMPGPLTLILKSKVDLPVQVHENGFVAVRIPDCEDLQQILNNVGIIAATSANFSGEPPILSYESAREMFGNYANIVILEDDLCEVKNIPSTIVKVENGSPILIREGALPFEDIRRAITNG